MIPYLCKRIALLAISLCLTEALLRLVGYTPVIAKKATGDRVRYFASDDALAWRGSKGNYTQYSKSGDEITLTQLDRGYRATGKPASTSDNTIFFIGGSITQGFGVSDSETIPWLVQEQVAELSVVNAAVGGYGSCQALIMMKQILNSEEKTPTLFVYPFISDHESRNVASSSWIMTLYRKSRAKNVTLPYCTIDADDKLKIHPPEQQFPMWRFRRTSSLARLFEELYVLVSTYPRARTAKSVTDRIFKEMDKVASDAGSILLIIGLSEGSHKRYQQIFEEESTNSYIRDCYSPESKQKEMQLIDDPHPNFQMNQLYSECMTKYIQSALNTGG